MLHGINYNTLSLQPLNTLHKEMIRLLSTLSQKADSSDYKYYIVLL